MLDHGENTTLKKGDPISQLKGLYCLAQLSHKDSSKISKKLLQRKNSILNKMTARRSQNLIASFYFHIQGLVAHVEKQDGYDMDDTSLSVYQSMVNKISKVFENELDKLDENTLRESKKWVEQVIENLLRLTLRVQDRSQANELASQCVTMMDNYNDVINQQGATRASTKQSDSAAAVTTSTQSITATGLYDRFVKHEIITAKKDIDNFKEIIEKKRKALDKQLRTKAIKRNRSQQDALKRQFDADVEVRRCEILDKLFGTINSSNEFYQILRDTGSPLDSSQMGLIQARLHIDFVRDIHCLDESVQHNLYVKPPFASTKASDVSDVDALLTFFSNQIDELLNVSIEDPYINHILRKIGDKLHDELSLTNRADISARINSFFDQDSTEEIRSQLQKVFSRLRTNQQFQDLDVILDPNKKTLFKFLLHICGVNEAHPEQSCDESKSGIVGTGITQDQALEIARSAALEVAAQVSGLLADYSSKSVR